MMSRSCRWRGVSGSHLLQQIDGVADRPERVAQLVRQHAEEFILAAVGFLRRLAFRALFRLHRRLAAHLVELDEHAHLGLQDFGDDGREQEVDGARRVALRRMHVVDEGGEENDGRMRRLAALADERGGLEPVHARHVDVEQDDREVVPQDQLERVFPLLAKTRFCPSSSSIVR